MRHAERAATQPSGLVQASRLPEAQTGAVNTAARFPDASVFVIVLCLLIFTSGTPMSINQVSVAPAASVNLKNFEQQGDWEVNINDPSEIRHWMQHWNVTEVELRKAVAEVGTDVTEVRIALGK
jgi:hypothetical protein